MAILRLSPSNLHLSFSVENFSSTITFWFPSSDLHLSIVASIGNGFPFRVSIFLFHFAVNFSHSHLWCLFVWRDSTLGVMFPEIYGASKSGYFARLVAMPSPFSGFVDCGYFIVASHVCSCYNFYVSILCEME